MAQQILSQSTAGADFTGLAGAGLFDFSNLDNLDRATKRLTVDHIGFRTAGACDWLVARWEPPVGGDGAPIIIGTGIAAVMLAPDGVRYWAACPGTVPRGLIGFWRLIVVTSGIDQPATVTVSLRKADL